MIYRGFCESLWLMSKQAVTESNFGFMALILFGFLLLMAAVVN